MGKCLHVHYKGKGSITSPAIPTLWHLPTCMLKLHHSHYILFFRQNMRANRAPACTLVSLPRIYYSCHHVLTESLMGDGGLVSPNILLPLSQTPLMQSCQASNSYGNLTFCICSFTCTVAPQEMPLVHWISPQCQLGDKAVYLKAAGLQADNLMKLWTSEFLPLENSVSSPYKYILINCSKHL